jgi:hypothetical protein
MKNTTMRTIVAAMSVLSPANMACFRDDSREARAAAESANRQIRRQSSVADVVEIAAAQDRPFEVLGVCGENGALNIHRFRGANWISAWRGSPSDDGSAVREYQFNTPSELRAALEHDLLRDGPCSMLFVGFPAHWAWHFKVSLGDDGRVTAVKSTEPWQ